MESGVSLESPTITAFRDGVLAGKWESVSRILQDGLIVQGEAATVSNDKVASVPTSQQLTCSNCGALLRALRLASHAVRSVPHSRAEVPGAPRS